jgi:TonB-linked SusC/RagA family outer membrane protein
MKRRLPLMRAFPIALLLIAHIFWSSSVKAQQTSEVKGTVRGENNHPLGNVSIVVRNAQVKFVTGTKTDSAGVFIINVPPRGGYEFTFTSVGYEPQTVSGYSVKGRLTNTLDVEMKAAAASMDQVVVIGYGTQKRKDLTGSVASISEAQIAKVPISNIGTALKGRIPGLDIVSAGTDPGSGNSILLRGRRSFKASNAPLIILDGMAYYGSLNDINPYDVKSVDVLKDASTTAIYGSQGANGVIIITTKRGRVGAPRFTFDSYIGTRSNYGEIPVLNAVEYVERGREARRAAGTYPQTPTDSADKAMLGALQFANYKEGVNTDWQKLLFKKGIQQNQQLSVSGGTEAFQYSISANHYSETGTIPRQKFERYSLKTNLDVRFSSKFKAGTSILLSHNIQQLDVEDAAVDEALAYIPLGKPYDDNGNPLRDPVNDGYRVNPLSDIVFDAYRKRNKRWAPYINLYGEYKILPSLTYRINLNGDANLTASKVSAASNSIIRRGDVNWAAVYNGQTNRYQYESILTFDKIFGDHHLTLTAVNSLQKSHAEMDSVSVKNLPYDQSRYYNIGSATNIDAYNSNLIEWTLLSNAGRLFYSFKDRYLLTATIRADGASQFAPNHKWGYFPSVALSWRLTEENFMQKLSWLSNLKVRASYGVSGNQGIDPYQTQGNLTSTTYAYDEASAYGLRPGVLANKNLKWESTSIWNLGLDFGFFNERINGSLNLYRSRTNDLLMDRYLPVTSGFQTVLQNVGITENKGIDLSLNSINVRNSDFQWQSNVIFYLNREQIVSLYNGKVDDVGNRWFIGKPISVFYDYKKTGIWQNDKANEAAKYGYKPGQIQLLDVNQDSAYTDKDRIILGSRQPKFVMNLTNTFSYRNWELSVDFYTRWGSMNYVPVFVPESLNRLNKIKVDYWTPQNPTNAYPQPNDKFQGYTYASTLAYRDASFIKLRQLSLGYTLPQQICNNLRLKNAKVYLTGDNLLTWTRSDINDFNLEPEASGNILSLPAQRTMIVGLNITF